MAVLAPVRAIASAEHEKLLDTIDQIRSQGISRYIDLPQIIVCGDQSVSGAFCLNHAVHTNLNSRAKAHVLRPSAVYTFRLVTDSALVSPPNTS